MPNWSPTRKVFTSVNKKLTDIPFEECRNLYNMAVDDLKEDAQATIDEEYEQEILEAEQRYSDSHEAPYEGNFRDSMSKPGVKLSAYKVDKATTARVKDEFIDRYGLHLHTDWMFPQIVTLLGNMRVTKNDNGKISGKRFKIDNFKTDWEKGLYRFIGINTKSAYLKLQYKAPAKSYGALVPLILYSQRLTRGTPYSAWDRDEIHEVVHSDLAEAMLYTPPSFTRDDLMNIRTEGLTTKSGRTAGTVKNPVSTYNLTGVSDPIFTSMPALVQVMLTQIWMAHPDNRTKYMILDPTNWDKMPASFLPSTPLISVTGSSPKMVIVDEAW